MRPHADRLQFSSTGIERGVDKRVLDVAAEDTPVTIFSTGHRARLAETGVVLIRRVDCKIAVSKAYDLWLRDRGGEQRGQM